MVAICFYFQVHQPYRIRPYTRFDMHHRHDYFDHEKNSGILKRVADKCYIPTNKVLLELIKKHPEFKVSFSITGVALDQMKEFSPEALQTFQNLTDTGNVEILSETYYHSLAFLFSKQEFKEQVELHAKKVKELFGATPKVFRNTELIYNNELANFVETMGYKGIIAEGVDNILGWRSPNFVYKPRNTNSMKLLLKNYKMSDDIAFRFSDRKWKEHPLTAKKFSEWIDKHNGNGEVINLFMDYETFGEHQWQDTGILEFLKHLPNHVLETKRNEFLTPTEVVKKFEARDEIDMHNYTSWADCERNLSAWLHNKMQDGAINQLYSMEHAIRNKKDFQLMCDWRMLQSSDHFYYMSLKGMMDGEVHDYFRPDTFNAYTSFISYKNILGDLAARAHN